jgi:hypothetical protein
LRLYEPHGNRANTTIEAAIGLRNASLIDILERRDQPLAIEDQRRIQLAFSPFQMISLKLDFTPQSH